MAQKGRPTLYSDEVAAEICRRLMNGESLRAICGTDNMPERATVHAWLADGEHKDFLDQYARAREVQADAYADDIVFEADQAFDKDSAAAAKVKVDARKWVASKLKPKRYGDKLDVTSDGKALPQPILRLDNITDDINKN